LREGVLFAFGVVGDGTVDPDNTDVDGFASEGGPKLEEAGDLGGAAALGGSPARVSGVGGGVGVVIGVPIGGVVAVDSFGVVEVLKCDFLGEEVEGAGVGERDAAVVVDVEAGADLGVVPFDELGERGLVVGDGAGGLEDELELGLVVVGVSFESLFEGFLAALWKMGVNACEMASNGEAYTLGSMSWRRSWRIFG
jgi:hypothetical protein